MIPYKYYLKVLITPSIWLRNGSTNHYATAMLLRDLELGIREKPTEHTALIGKNRYWIENHPYASFSCYNDFIDMEHVLPARAAVLYAYDQVLIAKFNS